MDDGLIVESGTRGDEKSGDAVFMPSDKKNGNYEIPEFCGVEERKLCDQ
jgi:hypothetical protein